MSRHALRARAGESRASLYDEITNQIIAELGGRPRALGSALGHGGGESAARHAEECRDEPAV